jgi:hypothetical protein
LSPSDGTDFGGAVFLGAGCFFGARFFVSGASVSAGVDGAAVVATGTIGVLAGALLAVGAKVAVVVGPLSMLCTGAMVVVVLVAFFSTFSSSI